MTDVIAALIPIFAIIAVGAVLRRLAFLNDDGWRAVERVTYFVLFPCFLFGAIAFADFTNEPLGRMSILLAGAMVVMAALVYPFRALLALDGPAFTSLFQGAVRWNSYVALGAIAAVLGPKGLALAAIAVAIMVPLANALCVVVLMRHANGETGLAMLARQLARNPLILACLAGIVVQLTGLPIPKVASTTVDLIGKAALPLGLLAVGASLDLGDARARPAPLIVATILKLVAMPALVAAGAHLLDVTAAAKTAALICAAVPGASSSYILARQLGGDAPLMANITTAQTLAAMLTMPIILWVFA
ncbi:MAG: AEC family transporter [Alphaproteobacteria bacterium]|nr:AEC family transporter [Alphaproteobacteria bacterium]